MEVTVLAIGKVGSIEVGAVVGVSWSGTKGGQDKPGDDDVVVGTIYFGVPCAPALVEAGRDECGDGATEIWTAKEGDVYPGSMGAQKGEEGENGRVWAGTG